MKKIIYCIFYLSFYYSCFAQLQTTNSFIYVGWDYPVIALDTNLTFKIISVSNNRQIVKSFKFDGDASNITNGFKFIKTKIDLTPGANTLVVIAQTGSLESFDSNAIELPPLAKVTVLRIKGTK